MNISGTQPIFWAVTSGNAKLVKLMIAHGADIHSTSNEGETLLTRAVTCGHSSIVRLMVENYGLLPDDPGHEQRTALQIAVSNMDVTMVKMLIELGALVPDRILNDVAKTGHIQLYKTLCEHVASLDQHDENGKFPLYHAIQNDAVKLAEELIKTNAKIVMRVCITKPLHRSLFIQWQNAVVEKMCRFALLSN